MTAEVSNINLVQQSRKRAMVLPREHGAWGLLLVPLFTGFVAGFSPEHRGREMLLLLLATLSLFLLRTPVESLFGLSPISARTSEERRTALVAAAAFSIVAGASLIGLMIIRPYSGLLILGAAAAAAFIAQALIRKLGRRARMLSQIVGALGLTCTAPAAYYVGTGRIDSRAIVLWIANWVFAGNQIHFVQLRIHGAKAMTFAEKFQRAPEFFLAQLPLVIALLIASMWRVLPPLIILAFIPMIVRGYYWFVRRPEPLNVRSLGWSEMRHGILFGILLACAFVI
jgi:YwiC-like protein